MGFKMSKVFKGRETASAYYLNKTDVALIVNVGCDELIPPLIKLLLAVSHSLSSSVRKLPVIRSGMVSNGS